MSTNFLAIIPDHCNKNDIMDWEMARVICPESDGHQRWIKEAIEIRKLDPTIMNSDDRTTTLTHTLDMVLRTDSRRHNSPLCIKTADLHITQTPSDTF